MEYAAVPSKTWELSLYELHRTPQEAITDGTEIAVSPRSLHSELMCPICLDMLKNTMTTKECLHRSFLQSCKVDVTRARVRVNTTSALSASNYCGRRRVATGLWAAGGRLGRHVDCRPTVDIGLQTVGLVYGTLFSS